MSRELLDHDEHGLQDREYTSDNDQEQRPLSSLLGSPRTADVASRGDGLILQEESKLESRRKNKSKGTSKRPNEVEDDRFELPEDLEMTSKLKSQSPYPRKNKPRYDSNSLESDGSPSDGGESETDLSQKSNSEPNRQHDQRAVLRTMMAQEASIVAATLSNDTKVEISKGTAVKQQRQTFHSLLNVRIKLQQALVSSNSLPDDDRTAEVPIAAEEAAIRLWNSLNFLRQSITSEPGKRSYQAAFASPLADLQAAQISHEVLPARRATLAKWARKSQVTMATRQSKLASGVSQQALLPLLDAQLTSPAIEMLIERTKVPRSCAPLQAAEKQSMDSTIYDDADFYAILLRELVDQKMPNTISNSVQSFDLAKLARQDLKRRRKVDPKASKGRLLKYTIIEKLQNFMAPEDHGTWNERQAYELFGGLFGRRAELSEYEAESAYHEEASLRLFGTQRR